jgi:hypothetical protein
LQTVRLARDQLVVAEVRSPLDVGGIHHEFASIALSAATRRGLTNFALPGPASGPVALGFLEADKETLLASLIESATQRPLYLTFAGPTQRPVRVLLTEEVLRHERVLTSADWHLHAILRDGATQLLAGPKQSCHISFWADKGSVYEALSPNRYSHLVAATREPHDAVTIGDRQYATLSAFSRPTITDLRFPIDAVYTWVNDDDPEWRARRDHALGLTQPSAMPSQNGLDPARHRQHDELRYSLRSISQYAPWIRHVYLVTDRQVPTWLDAEVPGITVVDHRDIFTDPSHLPAFNSHAIETHLHRIPGLSEQYLYFNDDVFLGRPVDPSRFFTPSGLPRLFLSKATVDLLPPADTDTALVAARKKSADLIERHFGVRPTRAFKHTPLPQRRSVHAELEAHFGGELAATSAHKFRSRDDVGATGWLHNYYALLSGQGITGSIAYDYFRLGAPMTSERLRALLTRRNIDVFCINDDSESEDSTDERDRQTEELQQFLEAYFPIPSPFERPRTFTDDPTAG